MSVPNQYQETLEFILDFFKDTSGNDLNYLYTGNFTQTITDSILTLAERSFNQIEEPLSVRRKVYYLMVEGLQNITRYQAHDGHQCEDASIFVIRKRNNNYYIATGNLIENKRIDYVTKQLENVNSLDKKELKEYYRKILTNKKFTDGGGAGLGLIEMARKSENKLAFDFVKLNENYSYFYLQTIIPHKHNKTFFSLDQLNVSLTEVQKIHQDINQKQLSLIFNSGFNQDSIEGLLSTIKKNLIYPDNQKKEQYDLLFDMLNQMLYQKQIEDTDNEKPTSRPGILFITNFKNKQQLNIGNYIKNKKIDEFRQKIKKLNGDAKFINEQKITNFEFPYLINANEASFDLTTTIGIFGFKLNLKNKLKLIFYKINEKYSFFTMQTTTESY